MVKKLLDTIRSGHILRLSYDLPLFHNLPPPPTIPHPFYVHRPSPPVVKLLLCIILITPGNNALKGPVDLNNPKVLFHVILGISTRMNLTKPMTVPRVTRRE